MSSGVFTQGVLDTGVFSFFNLSVIGLRGQEGRVEFRDWLLVYRKGGKSGQQAGYSTPPFIGIKASGEMNSSSVLLLKGSVQMYKCVLVAQK